MPLNHIRLVVPVPDIEHIPGTLKALAELVCHEQFDVEINVIPNFPDEIPPADQKALDDTLGREKQVLQAVESISTQPPKDK